MFPISCFGLLVQGCWLGEICSGCRHQQRPHKREREKGGCSLASTRGSKEESERQGQKAEASHEKGEQRQRGTGTRRQAGLGPRQSSGQEPREDSSKGKTDGEVTVERKSRAQAEPRKPEEDGGADRAGRRGEGLIGREVDAQAVGGWGQPVPEPPAC